MRLLRGSRKTKGKSAPTRLPKLACDRALRQSLHARKRTAIHRKIAWGALHDYEVRPRNDHRGVDLISDVPPFGRLTTDFRCDRLVLRYPQFVAQIRNTLKGKLGLPPDFSKYARSPAVFLSRIKVGRSLPKREMTAPQCSQAMLRSHMGGLANATYTLHRLHSLRYWDLGPKPLVGHCSGLAGAVIRVYDPTGNVIYGCADSAAFSLHKQ